MFCPYSEQQFFSCIRFMKTHHTLLRHITEEELTALTLLRGTGLPLTDAALLAKEAAACGRGRLARARRCLQLGSQLLKEQERTVTFRKAVECALADRHDKRPRTIIDFRYHCKRLMTRNPGLAERRMRSISAADCTRYLRQAFPDSPAQFRKARAALSGVFSSAIRHEWCDANPVSKVQVPRILEKPIAPLTAAEISRLEHAAAQPQHRDMQLSLHLMLYGGIRPTEVSRLRPADILPQEHQVLIRPDTGKTGGGRIVTLPRSLPAAGDELCIPRDWQRRWRALRRAAGFTQWVPDVCRHTFASNHAAYFRNLPELQLEMGHRDLSLLRTRYISPVPRRAAEQFWAHEFAVNSES